MKNSNFREKIVEIKNSYSEKLDSLNKSLEDLNSLDVQFNNISGEINQYVDSQISKANKISAEGGSLEDVVDLLANSLVGVRDHIDALPHRIREATLNNSIQIAGIREFQKSLSDLEDSAAIENNSSNLDDLPKVKKSPPRRKKGTRPEKIRNIRNSNSELAEE